MVNSLDSITYYYTVLEQALFFYVINWQIKGLNLLVLNMALFYLF